MLATSSCGRFEAMARVEVKGPAYWASDADWEAAIIETAAECEDDLDWQIAEDGRERAE